MKTLIEGYRNIPAGHPEDKKAWQSAHPEVLDIYETEYSLFGHLADTVLRTH